MEDKKTTAFPSFFIPEKNKNRNEPDTVQKWAKEMCSAIISYGLSMDKCLINELYNLAEGGIDEKKFSHITSFYKNPRNSRGLNRIAPAFIREINPVPALLEKRLEPIFGLNPKFTVVAVNPEAYSRDLDEFSKEATKVISRYVRQKTKFQDVIGSPLYEEDAIPVEESDIAELNFSNFRQNKSIAYAKFLEALMKKNGNEMLDFKMKHQLYKDYEISHRAIAHAYYDKDSPNFRVIDPRDAFYVLSGESPFIHRGTSAGYCFEATPQEIIDMDLGLSEKQILDLENLQGLFATDALNDQDLKRSWNGEIRNGGLYITCYFTQWRATKQVRVKKKANRLDKENPKIQYTDNNDKEQGASYEYKYTQELWQQYRVGCSMYGQAIPTPGQSKRNDKEKDLDIFGIVDNSPSFAQQIKELVYLRYGAMHNVERLSNQVKGNIIIVDKALKSNSADNVYNMMVNSTFEIDSSEHIDIGITGDKLTPKVIDMDISRGINSLMQLIMFFDNTIAQFTNIADYNNVSFNNGQMVFNDMSKVPHTAMRGISIWYTLCNVILNKLLKLANVEEKEKWIVGDVNGELIKFKPNIDLDDLQVFVENSITDDSMKQMYVSMAQQILPHTTDPNLFLSIVEMVNASNSAEALRTLRKGIHAMNQVNEYLRQQDAALQKQAQEAAIAKEQIVSERESEKNKTTLAAKQMEVEGRLQETREKNEARGDLQDAKQQDKIDYKKLEVFIDEYLASKNIS